MQQRQLSPALAVLAAVLLPASLAAQQPDTRPGIAVMPFTHASVGPNADQMAGIGVGLQEMMITELALNPNMRVVERRLIRETLDELGLATGGRVDDATAARIGKIVGARYFVKGVLVDVEGDWQLDAHIVSVETTEVVKVERLKGNRSRLYPMLVEMADKLTSGARLTPLEARVREARSSRPVPTQAMILYSQAIRQQDLGNVEAAKQLLQRATTEYPQVTEFKDRLRQLENPRG